MLVRIIITWKMLFRNSKRPEEFTRKVIKSEKVKKPKNK